MIKLAVFGDPIGHSLSPVIHTEFAEQAGLVIDYTRIQASAIEFAEHFSRFVSEGGVGANITLPLKELALELADQLTPIATQAGAVNTLVKNNGSWLGTNTDGMGLVSDIEQHNINLQGTQILLLGAGGAARGVVPALLSAKVASIHVANRTPERAEKLIQHASAYLEESQAALVKLSAGSISMLPRAQYNVIINATSSGLHGEGIALPEWVLNDKPFSYDMVYGDKPTLFMQWALSRGCPVADGLGMLVGQAAESFRLWTGVSPDIHPVLLQLRKRLGLWNSA